MEANITEYKKIEVFDTININDETKERLENIEPSDIEVTIYTSNLDSFGSVMKTPSKTIPKILKMDNISISIDDIKIFLHNEDYLEDIFGDDYSSSFNGYIVFKTQKCWYTF